MASKDARALTCDTLLYNIDRCRENIDYAVRIYRQGLLDGWKLDIRLRSTLQELLNITNMVMMGLLKDTPDDLDDDSDTSSEEVIYYTKERSPLCTECSGYIPADGHAESCSMYGRKPNWVS